MGTQKRIDDSAQTAKSHIAYSGRGSKADLPNVVKQGLEIASLIGTDGVTSFDDAYAKVKASNGGSISGLSTYKGVLSKYYENMANASGMDKEDYGAYVKQLGIPTAQDVEGMDIGTGDRLVQGAGKMWGQFIYGVGKLAGTEDNIQAERKQYVKGVKEKEEFWKAYNAKVDASDESGMNMPWNVSGAIGESLPYFATGLGASAVASKTASQVANVVLAGAIDTAVDVSRYQEHGDLTELAVDVSTNIIPGLTGTQVGNLWRKSDLVKDNVPSNASLRELKTKTEGFRLLDEGGVTASHKAVSEPDSVAAAVKAETNPQRQLDIVKSLEATQNSARNVYDESLDAIGPGTKQLGVDMLPEDQANPIGKLFNQYISKKQAEFSAKAKPYREAYERAGEEIDINVKDLLDDANFGTTNRSARSHIQKAINELKRRETPESIAAKKQIDDIVKGAPKLDKQIADLEGITVPKTKSDIGILQTRLREVTDKTQDSTIMSIRAQLVKRKAELKNQNKTLLDSRQARNANEFKLKEAENADKFDIENINANDLDEIVKDLNNAMSGGDQMGGQISTTTAAAITNWTRKAKNKLNDLPPEFSENYAKAKELYSDSFKLTQENQLNANRNSPIRGIEAAITDPTGRMTQELFTGPDALNNISNLGKLLPATDDLYGGIMRNYVESKMSPDMLTSQGTGAFNPFDLSLYKDSVKAMDWNAFKRINPQAQGAVDNLAGLEGVADILGGSKSPLTQKNIRGELPQPSTGFKKGTDLIQDLGDIAKSKTGISKPWWETSQPGLGDKLGFLWNKTTAPGSRPDVYEGAGVNYKRLQDTLDRTRASLGLPEDDMFVDVTAPMLDKLKEIR